MRRFTSILFVLCAMQVAVLAQANQRKTVVVISLDGFPAYAFQDPRLPTPTLRRLAQEGAMATGMHPINPTVTWPNHTAIITGVNASKHHVLFNGLLVRHGDDAPVTVEPWTDKDLLVRAPTVYDLAYKAGLTTAQVDWVAIYKAKTITWQFPEIPNPNGTIEKDLIAKGLVTRDQLQTFMKSSPAWRDEIWTDAAADILRTRRPNLMLFHLLDLDAINHKYGPMGWASMTAMAFLDGQVKQIIDALREANLLQQTTIFIVSDHGFRKVDHVIHPNVTLQENGLLKDENGKTVCDAWVVADGGVAMVYVTNPSRRAELLPRLSAMFAKLDGIDHVYRPGEFAGLGLPTSAQSDQAPDLFLAAKPGYAFESGSNGPAVTDVANIGTHGYLNSDPEMNATFIAWGNGIRPGIRLSTIENVDVAPTVAAVLGLSMQGVEGHVLRQILK